MGYRTHISKNAIPQPTASGNRRVLFFYKGKKENSSLSNQVHNSPFWLYHTWTVISSFSFSLSFSSSFFSSPFSISKFSGDLSLTGETLIKSGVASRLSLVIAISLGAVSMSLGVLEAVISFEVSDWWGCSEAEGPREVVELALEELLMGVEGNWGGVPEPGDFWNKWLTKAQNLCLSHNR